jgi:3'-5' exoribonuclease
MKLLFVSEIRENQPVDAVFMCAAKNQGVTKSGSGYLILKLLDRSGEIEGRVWDRANDLARGFDKSDYVRVRGQATLYQGKLQIRVHDVVRVNDTDV